MEDLTLLAQFKLSIPWQIVAATGVALVSTLVLTPVARWFATFVGVVDRPDGERKLQRKPVALLGGVAVLAGLGITVTLAAAFGALDDSLVKVVLVSCGLSILCAVGVIDDAYNLLPGWKLLAQIGASIPIVMAGYGIYKLNIFDWHLPLGPVGFLISMVWLVACTNAVNLIDGMDGLCSTVALCIAAGVTAIAFLSGAANTAVCAAAFSGAIAGFLVYNLPPAKIYLGDAGSMVIGMTLGLISMRIAQPGTSGTHVFIMLALMGVPLGDVALAMLRRKLTGLRVFQADRGHIHHRLLDRGMSVPHALAIIAGFTIVTSAIATAIYWTGSDLLGIAAFCVLGAFLISAKLVGHHEWALVRELLATRRFATRRDSQTSLSGIDAEPATLKLYQQEQSGLQDQKARKAA
jgi:UDP-GlcNAc:undecaprenyl-phosphate GlcNAc-1-phosphate transferase